MFWERAVDRTLDELKRRIDAPLRLQLWDGRRIDFSSDPSVTLKLNDARAALAFRDPSLLSIAQAYIDGHLDLEGRLAEAVSIVEKFARARARRPFAFRGPTNARHTRRLDRDAVSHHYDVSNAFYALWLDPRMVYSCAYFLEDADGLEKAQLQKLDHICTKLRLQAGERFLDVGCGWGALVIHAAKRYGVDATGITLSKNQHLLACERIREAGLEGSCRVLLQDYRDHPGKGLYDKVASVGMFEHVGLRNLGEYFGAVRRLLKEGGLFLNHGITSSDPEDRVVGMGAGEFIDRYVFPKGELAHLGRVVKEMGAQDFEVADVESLRPHYALTLSRWSANFESRYSEAVREAGERTARIWRLYLAGCAHGFDRGWVNVYQVLASRQAEPGPTRLPLTRDWMYAGR